jgi:hypothetical protein
MEPAEDERATMIAKLRLAQIVIGMICLFPLSLVGQASLPLDAGARVRVWTSEGRQVAGRVEAATSDTLVLWPDGHAASLSMPVGSLSRIDVSRGRSRAGSAWRRAKWGALIGAVPGAVLLGLQHEQVDGGSSVGKAVALGAWSGGLVGGAIGALAGAVSPAETWERVR